MRAEITGSDLNDYSRSQVENNVKRFDAHKAVSSKEVMEKMVEEVDFFKVEVKEEISQEKHQEQISENIRESKKDPITKDQWITLPYEDIRRSTAVSQTAALPLRHHRAIPKRHDGAVVWSVFYEYMEAKLIQRYGKNQKFFRTDGGLLNCLIEGASRIRYEIVLKDGGDSIDTQIFMDPKKPWGANRLEELNDKIKVIRAIQGQSGFTIDSNSTSRIPVTHLDSRTLWHGTDAAGALGIK
jgi:hypothetical protein